MSKENQTMAIDSEEEILELTSDMAHQIWMGWARTLLETENISEERTIRWGECMVPYSELPEEEKEKDRDVGRRILHAWKTYELEALRSKGIISDLLYTNMKRTLEDERKNRFFTSDSGE
jgi:hypothetical protein